MQLGKALYEGVLLDLPLAPFFTARLQGRQPLFDELSEVDPQLYRNLAALKRYNSAEVESLMLDFTVEEEAFGGRRMQELKPGGSHIAVTGDNVLQYVYLLAHYHLNRRLGRTAQAFAVGMSQVIPASWLRLFNPNEFNQLLCGGADQDVDPDDLMRYTQYSGGYVENSQPIRHFWQAVRSMCPRDRAALLKFVTSSSRPPLGGFKYLQPPFTVHKVDCAAPLFASIGGADVDRLPSASTCYNLLKLPNYRRGATLRKKLLYAIHSGAGFELS